MESVFGALILIGIVFAIVGIADSIDHGVRGLFDSAEKLSDEVNRARGELE